MKQQYVFLAALCLTTFIAVTAGAQAFRKGALLISVSEGATHASFTTNNTNDGHMVNEEINGDRDPLTLEYGLSKHWGIGINMGGDVLRTDPKALYGVNSGGKKSEVVMSECTIDANYHYFVTKRTDISAFGSVGFADVTFKGKDGDAAYNYAAGGGIIRVGTKAKYYFYRRIGVMCMVSAYSAGYSPKDVKTNTIAVNIDTKIKGYAIEFGLCTHLLKK